MMKSVFFLFLVLACTIVCVDLDGDGYDNSPDNGAFQDCCDSVLDGCFDPYAVNPGAFEIPNNGIRDSCFYNCNPADGVHCRQFVEANLPCDYHYVNSESYVLSGIDITAADTEPAMQAIDLCMFKDDDDDPSWGFNRQDNMIFALSDQTRYGFEIGIIGPDLLQASVLKSFGRIGPYNGEYMLSMSTGISQGRYSATPNNCCPPSYATNPQSTQVFLPSYWTNNAGTANNICTKPTAATAVYDSILTRFTVNHPTNMGAFSFKVLMLDGEVQNSNNAFVNTCPTATSSWFLAFKSGSTGIPPDGNFAIDKQNYAFNSFNPNIHFYTQCGLYQGQWPNNTCPDSDIRLEGTNYEYTSNWIPVGTSAMPGEVYTLLLTTFDQSNPLVDTTVLIDDFRVMSESRAGSGEAGYINTPYGYQYTADVSLVSLQPDVKGVYPASTTSITLTFVVRNEGPENAGDVTISFTPPLGTSFNSITTFSSCTVFPAKAPFENNSYRKCKLPLNQQLDAHSTYTGTITFNVLPEAPSQIHFRVTATTSSIDYVWGNNHLLQLVYINKPPTN